MKQDRGKEFSGIWFILGAAMLWGTTGTTQGLAPEAAHPVSIGAVRLAVGGTALLLVSLYRGSLFSKEKWSIPLVAVSAFFVAAYQLCFFSGVAMTGVAVGTMTAIGSAPVAAGVLGYMVRKERLGPLWFVSTLLAIIGCLFLVLSGGGIQTNTWGITLAFGAGISYAAYTVSMKELLEKHQSDGVAALVFFSASLLLAPFLVVYEAGWLFSPGGLVVALHLGLMTTAVAYWLFVLGLRNVKVGTAATLSLAEPLTATALGLLVLGERLTLVEWTGICFLFTGILLLTAGPVWSKTR